MVKCINLCLKFLLLDFEVSVRLGDTSSLAHHSHEIAWVLQIRKVGSLWSWCGWRPSNGAYTPISNMLVAQATMQTWWRRLLSRLLLLLLLRLWRLRCGRSRSWIKCHRLIGCVWISTLDLWRECRVIINTRIIPTFISIISLYNLVGLWDWLASFPSYVCFFSGIQSL